MKKIPQAFHLEYERWRVGFDAAQERAQAAGGYLFELKSHILEFRRFYERWHPRLLWEPKTRRAMETLEAQLSGTLEGAWTRQLHNAVSAYRQLRAAEHCLAWVVKEIEAMRGATEEELVGRRRMQREEMGEDLDPDRHLAEMEERVYEREEGVAFQMSQLAAAWPERINAALRERLEKLDFETATRWKEELSKQSDALEEPR